MFSDNKFPKEKNHYTGITAININSVMKIDEKTIYPQVYLEECKYKITKRRLVDFIDSELDLDFDD